MFIAMEVKLQAYIYLRRNNFQYIYSKPSYDTLINNSNYSDCLLATVYR